MSSRGIFGLADVLNRTLTAPFLLFLGKLSDKSFWPGYGLGLLTMTVP
jgi:hypothetical protein